VSELTLAEYLTPVAVSRTQSSESWKLLWVCECVVITWHVTWSGAQSLFLLPRLCMLILSHMTHADFLTDFNFFCQITAGTLSYCRFLIC
jgi:hypothetical protein